MTKKFYTRAFLVALLCIFLGGGNASAQVLGEVKTFKELTNYPPGGNGWRSYFTIDWDTQYLEVQIDGTNCKFNDGTEKPDNVLSIFCKRLGDNEMGQWNVAECGYVHMYLGSGTLFQYHKGSNGSTGGQKNKTVSDRTNFTIKVTKGEGIILDDQVLFLSSDMPTGFYNSEMTIASEEGTGRMHGTYKSVRLMNLDGTPVEPVEPVETEAVISSTRPNPDAGKVIKDLLPEHTGDYYSTSADGVGFCQETSIDWNSQKIETKIDLSGITQENDFFALTNSTGNFGKFEGTTTSPNLHCYINMEGTAVRNFYKSYFHYKGPNPDPVTNVANNAPSAEVQLADDKIATIEISKEKGSVYNGNQDPNQRPEIPQYKLIFNDSKVKVGSGESTKPCQSAVKYYYLRIVGADHIITSDNTLDEAAVNTFEGQNEVTVALKRSFVAGQWNTICLPFNVNAETMATLFGTYELCTLDNVQNNVMNFSAVAGGAITAGQPYLLKPSTAVVDPTFKKVDIVAGEPSQVNVGTGWGMKGTYGVTTLATDGSNLFIISGGKFMRPENEAKAVMKGMRAYFIVPSGTNAKLLRANLDGVETSIDAIGTDDAVIVDTTVYTIQGQRLGNTLEGLPRGLYIQNGKKVLVK